MPSNWRALPDGTAVVFAPRGAYGDAGGQTVFTHGVEIGLVPRDSDDLRSATDALIALLASDNPNLRRLSDDDRVRLANRPALRAEMSNVSDGDVPKGRAGRRRAPVQSGAARSQTFLPHSTDEVP